MKKPTKKKDSSPKTAQNISEQKLTEIALQHSKEKFRTIFNNASIGIALLDMEGHPQITNKALQQMVGYSSKELAQMSFAKFAHPEDADADMKLYKELVTGNRDSYQKEKRYIHKNGRTIWGNLIVTLIRDNKGQPQSVIGMVNDITDRKKVEENIMFHQNKLRSLASQLTLTKARERRKIAQFLHDEIGQKLALAMMKLGSLGQSLMAEGYQTATADIQDLIESIIQDTRQATFELSPPILYELGLEQSLEWLCEQYRAKSTIQFLFSDDEKPKPLEEDVRVILFQAVKELLMNAIKHSHAKTVEITVSQQKNQIHLTVKDDGKGFDPTAVQSYSLKKGGFGLFNIRERLEEFGGGLNIKSKIGHGTIMSLAAPLADRLDTPDK